MKSKRLIISAVIGLTLLLGTAAAAIGAVTTPSEMAPREAVVVAEEGTVEVKASGETEWMAVETASIEAGDSVRTQEDGIAVIQAFDQGELRLDHNTEITFDELSWNADGTFSGEVTLKAGRLWSRLLDFLSPDSSYQVKTDATVASVRGTAFSMEYGEMGDFVSTYEHLVSVDTLEGGSRQGTAVFSGDKIWSMKKDHEDLPRVVPVSEVSGERAWMEWNALQDEAFTKNVRHKLVEEATRQRPIAPTSPLYGFVGFAERVRLAFSGEAKKHALEDQFARSRMLDAYNVLEENPQKAVQIMREIHERYPNVDEDRFGELLLYWAHGDGNVTLPFVEEISSSHPKIAANLRYLLARRGAFEELEMRTRSARQLRVRMMEQLQLRDIDTLRPEQREAVDALIMSMGSMGTADEMDGETGVMEEEEMMADDGVMAADAQRDTSFDEQDMEDAPEETAPMYNIEDYFVPIKQTEPEEPTQTEPGTSSPEETADDPVSDDSGNLSDSPPDQTDDPNLNY